MKKSVVALCFTLALTLMFAACGSGSKATTPAFVVAANYTSGANIEVFSIDPTSAALTAASGSPYNFGLTGPDGAIVTHPNGKWVYVCDWESTNVVALAVDNTSGAATQTNNAADTGACDWSASMTITPAGKYIYTADFNSNVTAFSVDSTTGALTVIGSPTTAAGQTMNMITASDSYVYGADEVDNIYIMKIGSDGSLGTPTVFAGTQRVDSIAVDRSQKFLYTAGSSGTGYGLQGYSIGSDGSLTSLGSQVIPSGATGISQMAFSGDNKFMYAADGSTGIRGFSFSATGAITELTGSPFSNTANSANSVAMDPTGKVLVSDNNCSDLYSWTRDTSTGLLSNGALTPTAGHHVCQLTVTWK
ncbi:MAG TPA: beta-propeller fold lactonase family protein [Terriglobales bacterium]|nr:beta-propeller fold lactonase family protein [Terriglobales bacterium]